MQNAPALKDPPYLAALNAEQRSAVEALDGAVLVLAGAGTGKTRVLTTRLAHLLATGKARTPGEILAVTFTNKAAAEMKSRVASLLGLPGVERWWLGTFHAIAARMLRDHAERVGLTPNFTILDDDDQVRLLKQELAAEGIDDKKWPARMLSAVISRWKDRGLTPDKVTHSEAGELANGRAVELYRRYQGRLKTLNACDFGDLLLHCLTIFQTAPEVLELYHRRFRFLLVDEYQDTNVAQYLWLRFLAKGHSNICCVGDDDQSIYGWRGAEVGNILKFEEDFPGAKIIRLERNYRSTGNILGAASALIAHNQGRLGKTLWTEDAAGDLVRLRGLWDGEAEARFVGEEIEALQTKKHALSEMAVLVRTGAQTREFEERFITLGLAYRVVGGPRFYERMEIRDALAYLKLVLSPSEDLAFERIINKPKRGLGDATLKVIHASARGQGIPLYQAARQLVETDELRPQARKSLADLLERFEDWRERAEDMPHPELAEVVLDESGYVDMWRQDKSLEAPGRVENLKELINAIAEFDTLAGFLEHVALVMENIESQDREVVTLMTLHAAKGLEFETVFLAGWEEGLFPNQRALDESGMKGLEEERRLAYVGLTRAKKRAYITYAANRRMFGSWMSAIPSRFIDELPEERIEVESDTGGYAAASAAMDWGEDRWSPGFNRARQRKDRTPTFIDLPAVTLEGPGAYTRGDKVFHRKFGYGKVTQVEGERLTIDFDLSGEKKVVAAFVVPAAEAS